MIKKIRHAVGAIIVQNNEYLLVHKVKQMEGLDGPISIDAVWDFPKGGVHPAETLLNATQNKFYCTYLMKKLDNFTSNSC